MSDASVDDKRLVGRLESVVADLDLADSTPQDGVRSAMRRRRGYEVSDYSGLARLSLVRDAGGFLRWVSDPPARGGTSRRRRRAASRPLGAEVLHSFSYSEVPVNQVVAAIESLDARLTPNQGLRLLRNNKFEPCSGIKVTGRALLLVHGTFSKSDMFVDELGSIPAGRDFLAAAQKRYEEILAFDHPTLSVSPWINALDLESELANVEGPVDVVCHSRGGLVVAWWLRNRLHNVGTVIFVGSPLEGTSLASPARLRNALDMLANIFQGLELAGAVASTIVPIMSAATGLAKIVGGALRIGAQMPLADAGIAIVPGLAAQSLVANNSELRCLRRPSWACKPNFYAVVSNFEPGDSGAPWWQFWKSFRSLGVQALGAGADAIFGGKNDLVVDTESMKFANGASLNKENILDFGDSPTVHHCNYFSQDRTAKFLSKTLKI